MLAPVWEICFTLYYGYFHRNYTHQIFEEACVEATMCWLRWMMPENVVFCMETNLLIRMKVGYLCNRCEHMGEITQLLCESPSESNLLLPFQWVYPLYGCQLVYWNTSQSHDKCWCLWTWWIVKSGWGILRCILCIAMHGNYCAPDMIFSLTVQLLSSSMTWSLHNKYLLTTIIGTTIVAA